MKKTPAPKPTLELRTLTVRVLGDVQGGRAASKTSQPQPPSG